MKKLLVSFLNFILLTPSILTVVSCGNNAGSKIDGDVSFYMLSIGNGQFTFLKYDDNKAIIFDAGVGGDPLLWYEDDFRKNEFATNFMKEQGIEEVEAVFITHNHTDHYANLWKVDEEFKINNLILPYNNQSLLSKINSGEILVENNKETNILTTLQESYNFGGIKFNNWSYYITDYMKNTMSDSSNENNRSTVIQFTVNGVSFLITGDAESEEASEILKEVTTVPVDVFQVPHHGSSNAASTNLLRKIKPKYCYISGTSRYSEIPEWSNFDGDHPFPTAGAINNLVNNCSEEINLTGSPYDDNYYDLDNYNATFEFKINADQSTEVIKHDVTILDTL